MRKGGLRVSRFVQRRGPRGIPPGKGRVPEDTSPSKLGTCPEHCRRSARVLIVVVVVVALGVVVVVGFGVASKISRTQSKLR